MQLLRLHARTDVQRRRCRENGIRAERRLGCVVVGNRDGPQEVVRDLQEVGLLQPDFARGAAAAEEERAAGGFAGEGAGLALGEWC